MGVCNIIMGTCECNYCWTNFKVTTKQCNYRQKSQSTAFILSFLLGYFGVDHMYTGNYILVIQKIVLFIIFIFIYKFTPMKNDIFNNKRKIVICSVILGLIIFILYINDIILFGLNKYTDKNNIQLCKW
jgi:uncharacterized membrane protein